MSRERVRYAKDLTLSMPPEVIEQIRTAAARLGYTVSAYVAALTKNADPVARPGADMQNVALAGNRIVTAISVLQDADSLQAVEAIRLLREAQRFVQAELLAAVPAYEDAVRSQVAHDSWSGG